MIPLIDILIILSGISAAQAGPMRRYANTTSHALNAMTGIAYQPYAGSPSLSLAPAHGTAVLPSSQALKPPASIPVASSTSIVVLNKASNAMATSAAPFQYQPLESDSADNNGASSTMYNLQDGGPPTVFWTFGSQHIGTIVTITSTTYTTVSARPEAVESSAQQESTTSQAVRNTTATSAHQSSWTFVYDPLTTSTDSPTTETAASPTTSETSATGAFSSPDAQTTQPISTFAYPYPSSSGTTSTAAPSQQSDASESTIESSTTTSFKLPEVTTGDPSATQTQADAADAGVSDTTTAVPGITIVPQNPSVIYITVTDAGATTTVTA
jgi:hypothetical protein